MSKNGKKPIIKTQWDEKYLREQHFMPFGSMMNAFGLVNHGKGLTTADFIEAASEIYSTAEELTEQTYIRRQEEGSGEDFDVPQNQ